MNRYSVILFTVLGMLTFSCQLFNKKQENKLLAEVFDMKLYASDVSSFIPPKASKEDSILLVSTYVNRWTKEAIMLHEAEKARSKELNIDALVEDYRSSLIRHHYEQRLIEDQLDTVVQEAELRAFYERNKAQYELETPIVRAYVIKLDRSVEKPNQFNRWWENARKDSTSYQELKAFCDSYAEIELLEDSTWHSLEYLNDILPPGSLTESNVRSKKDFTQRSDDYEYFYQSFDIINKRGIAPFSYIEDQARRFILQQRKQELLQKKREETYQQELLNNNIRIYVED